MTSLVKGDAEFIKYLAQFVHLRPCDLAELTGRSEYVVWRRLRTMTSSRTVLFGPNKGEKVVGRGYVNYLIEGTDRIDERADGPFPANENRRVYFLTQKGWNKALDLGFVKHKVNFQKNSNQNLDHDLKLTRIHLALWRRYKDRVHWFQYRPFTYVDGLVNADAFLWIDFGTRFPAGFVEVENHKESGHKADGDLVDKSRQFAEYANSFGAEAPFEDFTDFYVFVYRLSSVMSVNFAKKLRKIGKPVAGRRFMLADIPSAIAGTERFITPKDYEQASYTFEDL
jgi:hypothetical protein